LGQPPKQGLSVGSIWIPKHRFGNECWFLPSSTSVRQWRLLLSAPGEPLLQVNPMMARR